MKRQDVTSREYKVMPLPDRFPGAKGEVRPVGLEEWVHPEPKTKTVFVYG
jgi:hypothetical protein